MAVLTRTPSALRSPLTRFLAGSAIACAIVSGCASAGADNVLRLTVVDLAGHGPIPGVDVVLTNSRTGKVVQAATDSKGEAAFPSLHAGEYSVSIPMLGDSDSLSSNQLIYGGGRIDLRIEADLTSDRKGWSIAPPDDPSLRPLTETIPPDLVVLFRPGTTIQEINGFLESAISVPDPRGGFAHRAGVGGFRITRVGNHDGYVVSWRRSSTAAQWQDVRRRIDGDRIVCRVLENIEPSSIDPATVACR